MGAAATNGAAQYSYRLRKAPLPANASTWACAICHARFSGPEEQQQHLKTHRDNHGRVPLNSYRSVGSNQLVADGEPRPASTGNIVQREPDRGPLMAVEPAQTATAADSLQTPGSHGFTKLQALLNPTPTWSRAESDVCPAERTSPVDAQANYGNNNAILGLRLGDGASNFDRNDESRQDAFQHDNMDVDGDSGAQQQDTTITESPTVLNANPDDRTQTRTPPGSENESTYNLPQRSHHPPVAKLQLAKADLPQTNDECAVSKRSVEDLYKRYYPEPHFHRHFVKKKKKRAPLVNRCYWLRMQIMERRMRRWLDQTTSARKVVINLGCGYDATPFQMLARASDACQDVKFVDLDFPSVIENKVKIVAGTEELSLLLDCGTEVLEGTPVKYRSEQYVAIACDLADISTVVDTVSREVDGTDAAFLVVAEVSLAYMMPQAADRLIAWAASLGTVRFLMLEQTLPVGPRHPFAKKMLDHYKKIKSPLLCIDTYPTVQDQERRFQRLGFGNVSGTSLWQIWSDPQLFLEDERTSLKTVERFDEWEDLALVTEHWFFLEADRAGRPWPYSPGTPTSTPSNTALEGQAVDAESHARPRPSDPSCAPRSHGALYQVQEGVFEYHGGYNGNTRVDTTDTYTQNGPSQEVEHLAVEARQHHTVTTFNSNYDCLLVGGRGAPGRVFSDCWLRQGGRWRLVDPLPRPLYRHAATSLKLSSDRHGVLVFGGKSSDEAASDGWYLWVDGEGWLSLDAGGSPKDPRFGAILLTLESDRYEACLEDSPSFRDLPWGMMAGGMRDDGTVVSLAMLWAIEGSRVLLSGLPKAVWESDALDRFGAKAVNNLTGLTIVGGITPFGFPEDPVYPSWVPGQPLSAVNIFPNRADAGPIDEALFMGHEATWDGEAVAVVGGGASCFPAGTHMNTTIWRIYAENATLKKSWKPVKPDAKTLDGGPAAKLARSRELTYRPEANKSPPTPRAPARVYLDETESLIRVVQDSQPAVIEQASMGPCTRKWTTEYLKKNIGRDRELEIHDCDAQHMWRVQSNGQVRKNFEFARKRCDDFIDTIIKGQYSYLRSVKRQNKSKEANFPEDFPGLAGDWELHEKFSQITDWEYHSSVLRISGNVNMWLHYDVLPNFLFQIRGTKRIFLFPPSDIANLGFPAGSSGSALNVFDPKAFQTSPLAETSPYEVFLKAGEVLFIPPLWCHAVSPRERFSVTINIFFKTRDGSYYQGKDTYGNKGIEDYAIVREGVRKATERFANLPEDHQIFYLSRIAKEMQDKVEGIKQKRS